VPVRIVTDSACDLSETQATSLGIEIVPLSVRFGSDEYVDRVELSVADFYRKMAASPDLPETSAPSPGAFDAAFRRCADAGADAVVCINLSSRLSATMQSAETAAKAFGSDEGGGDLEIHCLDSESVTLGLGTLVQWAAEQALDGADAETIVKGVRDQVSRQRVWATLDTLDNLKKGGRIGGAKALLGTLLSVKPAIAVVGGVVEEAGKPRTRKKALQWLADKVLAEPSLERLNIVHGEAPDVEQFIELLAPRYGPGDYTVGVIGPVIGAHGGPRVIGVTYQVPG
jgi:DegV family protein with EDD domain